MHDDLDPRRGSRGSSSLLAFLISLVTTIAAFTGLTLADQRGLLPFLHGGVREAEVPSLAGSRAVAGTSVQAFVSSGPGTVAIPPVAGTRPEDAVALLRARALLAGPRRAEPSDTVAAGLVIGSDPPAGAAVGPDTAVVLVVSTGPAPKAVPRVIGLRMSRAKKLLEEAGFKVGSTKHGSSDDFDEDVVIRQDPADKTPAGPGTPVNLTINE